MSKDPFEDLMRDAAQSYHVPPEAPLDEMWKQIAPRTAFGEPIQAATPTPRASRVGQWLALAATLVIGVALGRASLLVHRGPRDAPPATAAQTAVAPVAAAPTTAVAQTRPDSFAVGSYGVETTNYLDQTAALLVALPSKVGARGADSTFLIRASDLLTTTRLLIDSPASDDPAMRALLEDLELVLAQVVRLHSTHSRTELDLINRALEQRDVMPRLRTAVADISATN